MTAINIQRSIDIEETIRSALAPYLTVYCRPLPADFTLPSILITQVGGSDLDTIDTFEVVLDARAEHEEAANLLLRNAIGILKAVSRGRSKISYVQVNSSGSWGRDPARPDLAMCSARLRITAHLENVTLT